MQVCWKDVNSEISAQNSKSLGHALNKIFTLGLAKAVGWVVCEAFTQR